MYLVVKEQKDGFGSQYQNIISAIIFSSFNNIEYIHRPLKNLEHNYNDDKLFTERMEKIMNIDKKYKRINQIEHKKPFFDNPKGNYKKYFDQNIEKYLMSETLENIKKSYMSNKQEKEYYFPENTFNICVHLRRQNSHDSRGVPNYDNDYINIMKKLEKKYEDKNYMFHIISQGNIKDFQNFNYFKKIKFHLNELNEISFHRMVISDILMTNASSYSYTAALLSNGIIYYKKFWHKGSKKWIHF